MIILNLKEFEKDRDEALFSLDEKKIRAFFAKYDMPKVEDKRVFWGSVYKAIVNLPNAPLDVKVKANTGLKKLHMDPSYIMPNVEIARHFEPMA